MPQELVTINRTTFGVLTVRRKKVMTYGQIGAAFDLGTQTIYNLVYRDRPEILKESFVVSNAEQHECDIPRVRGKGLRVFPLEAIKLMKELLVKKSGIDRYLDVVESYFKEQETIVPAPKETSEDDEILDWATKIVANKNRVKMLEAELDYYKRVASCYKKTLAKIYGDIQGMEFEI